MRDEPVKARVEPVSPEHSVRRALADVKRHLQRRGLKLVGWALVVYAVFRLIPGLEQALRTLEGVSWEWVLALLAFEVLSETGFIFAWSAILDPDRALAHGGGGRRIDEHVAWAQLGGGLFLPGGSWGGIGVGSMILHRFGMSTELIAERQFNLSFLNTGIDALALVIFGAALASGGLAGERDLLLTLLPAALAAAGIVGALLLAPRAGVWGRRLEAEHHKMAATISTLAAAVQDTKRILCSRRAWTTVAGMVAYLGFDVAILWCAFLAVHASPVPGFPIVLMAYIIGALGGSIPLPAGAGTIGGIAGMLILYGVGREGAIAAVLIHQAIALLIPFIGGSIAYTILRRRFGPILPTAAKDPVIRQARTKRIEAVERPERRSSG
ncbi:MAG TPA: lysylphosphatidylglycerol synthase domain-containing protein [Solirubrobacteraceae bacterium]|nr:lysylphosphatidylglycerol synthase domain-containing protein [Solirubrobacteraceae bacterium]